MERESLGLDFKIIFLKSIYFKKETRTKYF